MEYRKRNNLIISDVKNMALLILIFIFGTSCEIDSENLNVSMEHQALSAKGGIVPSLDNLLNDALPLWSDKVNVTPEGLSQFTVASLKDAIRKTQGAVDFGCDVNFQSLPSYLDEDGMKVIKENATTFRTNSRRDYIKFVTPVNLRTTELEAYTAEAAETMTKQLFSALSLPKAEQGKIFSSPVIQKTSEGSRIIAQHSRVIREINGLRVEDSVLMATYNMDGTLFRMTVNWPKFQTKPGSNAKTRQEVISDLKAHLTEEKIDSIINITDKGPSQNFKLGMLSTLSYERDKSGEYYEPILYVTLTDSKDQIFPQSVRYSLTNGILEDDHSGDDL
ncbi:MAG: hypothetical protein QNJ97_24795 [Myxococcota bacterium]|nr:hypothetical protein [Myxococcota bacterium]